MVLEHPLLSHSFKPYSWHQDCVFLIKNTGFSGVPKVPASHSTYKATKVISAQFQSSHKPALLHPGNDSLIFPNSPVFHLYNPAKKRTNRIPGEGIQKGLLNLSKLTVFSLLPLIFFLPSFPQIYPPAQHLFFCL